MVSFRSVMAATLMLSIGAGHAAHSESALFRTRVEAAHARYAQLYKKKDMNGVEAFMRRTVTPDFRARMPDGRTLTLRQWMAEERKNLASARSVEAFTFHTLRATASGGTGKTAASAEIHMTVADPKGKPHKLTNSGRFTEVYVKRGGDWKLKSIAMMPETMTMDGKPWKPAMWAAPPKPPGGYGSRAPGMKPRPAATKP